MQLNNTKRNKNTNIRLCRDIIKFIVGYQPRNKQAKDETGYMLVDSHST
jgi:hypothetical protein